MRAQQREKPGWNRTCTVCSTGRTTNLNENQAPDTCAKQRQVTHSPWAAGLTGSPVSNKPSPAQEAPAGPRGPAAIPQRCRYSLESHGSRLQRAPRRGLLVQLAEELLGLALVLLQVAA